MANEYSLLVQAFEAALKNVLQANLGISFPVDAAGASPEIETVAVDALPFASAGSNDLLITAKLSYAADEKTGMPGGEMPLVVHWPYDKAFAAANLILGETAEPGSEPLNAFQQSAIEELISQWYNASTKDLTQLVDRQVSLTTPKVQALEPDAIAEVLGDAGNVVHMLLTVAAGEVLGDFSMSLVLPEKLAKLMLESNDDNTQPATEPAEDDAELSTPEMSFGGAQRPVTQSPAPVQSIQFGSLDQASGGLHGDQSRNLQLVMDVMLDASVELGRTHLSVKEVLELNRGSVIELERIAGEPVDLMINGKLIAKGEVVVIEDNFGLRITQILSASERLKTL